MRAPDRKFSPSRGTRVRSCAWRSARMATRIVSGSEDRTLKVWDADKGQEILTLKGHTEPRHLRGVQPRRQTPRQRRI